ncbi:MAG TPA: hypothetical protein VH134_18335 [Candidatus Dormibacteraeota bacterium]|nr:hypothetical protein [Candidatus Dormibacteraeota bacterium]
MRVLRSALVIGLAAASLGWAAGDALVSPRADITVSNATLDGIVRASLDEETLDGWNPATSGLYINWSSVDPTQVNFTDHNTSRHDAQTDLRDLDDMLRYEQQHPGDTSQQAGIARLMPGTVKEFHKSSSTSGWVYWELLDLAALTGDPSWSADAVSMATHYAKAIDPLVGYSHGKVVASTDPHSATCSDGFRVDGQLELGAMLIDAGKRFGNAMWTVQGQRAYTVVRAAAFDPAHGFYDRIICNGARWDQQAKVEEIADEARTAILAGQYAGVGSLTADGLALLDTLVANHAGLHDDANGGWCPLIDMGTGVLDCHIKTARQFLLLRVFHEVDRTDPGRYLTQENELINLVPRIVTSPHAGFLYERAPDFSLYRGENWITTESDGIVLGSIQSVLADGGSGTTTTTATTTSTGTSTATSTMTTTTTSTTTTARSTTSSTTTSSSSTAAAGCPTTTTTTTGTVSTSSVSIFVTATQSHLCATLGWTGGGVLNLIIYNSGGSTTLGQVTTGTSPETLSIPSTPGTVYKVKVKPISGSATYTLTTAA